MKAQGVSDDLGIYLYFAEKLATMSHSINVSAMIVTSKSAPTRVLWR